MLTAGPRATLGLLSPGDRPIERGDRFTVAFGIWGALNCRAGFVVEDADELPAGIGDYVERLVGPYFEAVAEWYGALHVGQTGGDAPGDRRSPPRRPVLRHLPQPGPPDPPRRVGQLADRAAARRSSCARGWRSRSTSSRRPGRTTSRRTSRTASRWPTQRCGPRSPPLPGGLGADRGPPTVHGRRARDRPPPRRPAVLEPAGVPAAVPAPAGPGDDRRGLTRQRLDLSRSGGTSQRSVPVPAASGRSMSIRARAPLRSGSVRRPAQLRDELAEVGVVTDDDGSVRDRPRRAAASRACPALNGPARRVSIENGHARSARPRSRAVCAGAQLR